MQTMCDPPHATNFACQSTKKHTATTRKRASGGWARSQKGSSEEREGRHKQEQRIERESGSAYPD